MLGYENFRFSVNQEIVYGVGCINQIPEKLEAFGVKKPMIVCDAGIIDAGLTKKIETILQNNNIPFAVFGKAKIDPDGPSVKVGVDFMEENACDCLIAIGGGSSIDSAKGIAAFVPNRELGVLDISGVNKIEGELAPIIAIPTTVGTGSESTSFSILTSPDNRKMVVSSYKLLPKVAFLDPEMVTGLPAHIAAATGVDAITHAIEAYLSTASSPFSDLMAEKALELLGQNIRNFVARRDNINAAGAMILGSNYAGIAFNHARLGNIHAMAHPMGGLFHIPHGVANASLMPTVLEWYCIGDTGKFETIYKLLKGPKADISRFESIMLANEIRTLLKDIDLPDNISALGIKESDIDALVEGTLNTTTTWQLSPRATGEKEIRELFMRAL